MQFPSTFRFILPFMLALLAAGLSSCLDLKLSEEPQPGVECITIARTLARAVNRGRAVEFDARVDYDAYADRMLKGIPLTPTERKALRIAVRDSGSIGQILCEELNNGGSYTLLHLRTVEGEPRVLVRIRRSNGSFSYHDLVFGYRENYKGEPGPSDVAVRDVYLYEKGAYMSTVMRQYVEGKRDKSFIEALAGKDIDTSYEEVMVLADSMQNLIDSGEPAKVRELYAALPARLQSERLILTWYVSGGRMEGEDQFQRAVDVYARYFPVGVETQLYLMDKYEMMKRYDDLLHAIDRLDSLVDGDPYLRFYRGSVHLAKGDTTAAIRWMKSAIKEELMLEDAYRPLIHLLVSRRDFSGAIPYLNALVLWFDQPLESLDANITAYAEYDEKYSDFLKSDRYRKWKDKRLGITDSTPEKSFPAKP